MYTKDKDSAGTDELDEFYCIFFSMLCSMHIQLSKLELIFGFQNVTLEAVL